MTENFIIVSLGEPPASDLPALAAGLGNPNATAVSGVDAAIAALSGRSTPPSFMAIDIGSRSQDVLAELDSLAAYCEPTIRVAVLGIVNDIHFYRALKERGVVEYFTQPIELADVIALGKAEPAAPAIAPVAPSNGKKGRVISVVSAASADGATTVAMNLAYCLATEFGKSVVLIDMDYQYGLVAKSLNLKAPYGIRELFEYPDRGLDNTLVNKMLAKYDGQMNVIAAPSDLRLMPQISPEQIRSLISILRGRFDCVIIDVPHIWADWTAAAHENADKIVIVAQLWLRSLTHATRLLAAAQSHGITRDHISLVINRSGAKFKEAISTRDFENVSHQKITTHLPNDVKAVVGAEDIGKTLFEMPGTEELRDPIRELAMEVVPGAVSHEGKAAKKRFSLFKG